MSNESRVWISPSNPDETNLNQTALHSEDLLKLTKLKSSVLPLLDSNTDFLLTSNLNEIIKDGNVSNLLKLVTGGNFSQGADFAKSENMKIHVLPPRDNLAVASGCNIQPSEMQSPDVVVTQPDAVPLKNSHDLTSVMAVTEDGKPQVNFMQLLNECGIECREEIVESASYKSQQYEISSQSHTYIPGHIVCGGKEALEALAQDVSQNKLKTGIHGVITNQAYSFLTNPKSAQKRQKILGRGGNGKVDLWSYKESQFVTKTIFRDFHPSEVLFTNSLSHEFIVKSHGLIVRDGQPQIVMDYAGDNLLHYGLTKSVEESEIWNFTYQILEALDYLHGRQIVHFDVKPENIVLMDDEFGHKTLKLADFGGAALLTDDVDCLSWTPAYMAPEMCQFYLNRQFPKQQAFTESCGNITEKSDIYSLALSVLFMYVKGHILIKHVTKGMQNIVGPEKADSVSINIVISNAKNPSLGSTLIPPNVGKAMRTLLSSMLVGKVDDRITAKQAMDRMKELACEITEQPKKIMRRKSRSTENKPKAIKPREPKLIIVTLDNKGKQIKKETSDPQSEQYDRRPLVEVALDVSEQQRPLKDLNIDFQLNSLLQQVDCIEDQQMKQVVEEENRPLLKRLVKRKLKEKVNEGRAFKMTRMMEELQSSASSSASSVTSSPLSSTVTVVEPEPVFMDVCQGPGNIPNFDMFDL